MKPVRVFDPGHILAVCTHAAFDISEPGDERGLPKIAVTATAEAVTIRIAADAARVAAILGAVHRAGYDAAANGDTITVRGWSPARLNNRIKRLDAAVQWLTEQLAFTPRTATALYQMETERPAAPSGRAARNRARHFHVRNLRQLIQRQTGLPTWQDPPGHPADPRIGTLLHQCQWLEDEIDLLLSRHRAIATQAIAEHRLHTEHPAPAEPAEAEPIELAAADEATQTADATTPPATVPPAVVAAHDAPALPNTASAPTAPSRSGAESDRDVRPVTSPARRGA